MTGRQQLRQHPHTFSSSTKSLAKAQTSHTDRSVCIVTVVQRHYNSSCGWLCAGARPYLSLAEAGHPTPADAAENGAAGYERQVSGYTGNAMLSPTSTAPMTARSIQGGADYRRCAPPYIVLQGLHEKQSIRCWHGTSDVQQFPVWTAHVMLRHKSGSCKQLLSLVGNCVWSVTTSAYIRPYLHLLH